MRVWLDHLKNILTKRGKSEYFLALILGDRRIQSLVFEKLGGKVEILGKGSENLSSSIEETQFEDLVEVCDKVISDSEENLPPNVFTSKTILGLKDDWVAEGVIKKEYLEILKKLKKDLELEFLGFIVLTQAVSHLLQKEEGVPTTSILVGKEGDNLTIAIVRAGHITKLVTKEIEDKNYSRTLEKVLRTFKDYEILPSRITLFDESSDLEEIRQELLTFPWTKTLPFLHFPKIEILQDDFLQRAIVAGFATQMGVEFDTGQHEETTEVEKTEESQVETFGFVKDQDVLEGEVSKVTKKSFHLPSIRLPKVKLPNIPPIPSIPSIFSIKNLRLLFLPIVVLLILIGVYIFLPTATVTLYVTSKNIQMDREITFDSTISTTDLTNNKVKADLVEIEVSDSLEGAATGKKEVGEKARGEVTIYNSSTEARIFAIGTIITGPNNLKFSLDDKASVASASGDVFSGTTPSKVKIGVTAVQIGEESNLPSGTTFNIGNIINVAAKNDNAFSGGSKKEVNVVSRADQDSLTKTLLDKLAQNAKENLFRDKSQDMQKIVDNSLSQEIIEKKFSKTVDEEASRFSLFLKVKFKALSFNQSEVQNIFGNQISQAAGDFVVKSNGINISFENPRLNKNRSVSASVKLTATLLPKIDEKTIKNRIRAQSLDKAFQILATTPNISDYKIKLSPVFPLLPKIIPWRTDNIKINIE